MSASGVYVQRFDGPSESKMDLTASQSDIGSVKKGKTCNGLTKVLGFVAFLALAVAVAACVALVVIVHRQDEIKERYDNITAKLDAQAQKPPVKPPVKTTTPPPPTVPVDNTVCLTPQCAVTAARVYEALDLSVNPCDNFFDYACGNWIRKHPIPEDRSSVSTFGVLSDELSVTLKALLEMESTDDEIEAVTKAKNLYKSCINEDLIEEMGAKPLMNYLESNYGHWPMTNSSWDPDSFDLVDVLTSIRQFGSTPIMYQGVSTDLKNSSYRILELDQPYLLMPGRDYYLSKANDSLPALRAYITSLAEALGASDSAQLAQDVEDVLEFETKVANLTIPAEQRRDPESLYNLFTIRELYTNISDKFDWFKFQRSVMSQEGVGINITEDEPLIVYSPVYLKNVVELVANTPKRTLANYILTGEVMSVVTALPKKFRDIRAEYVKVLFGVQSQSARWRTCVGSAAGSLSNAVGRLFVDSSFDEDAKDIADDMISTIRTSFGGLLKELDWMDDATRGVAKIKANAMREFIGYSEKDIKNDTALNEKYKYVTYHPEKYFENILSNAKQGTIEGLKKLRERIDKTEWIAPPAIVNAFYSSTRNSITFPAGILQPPFFWKYYPKSMNYGGIGVVIGHEITHGFDDRGREFDKDGDLKQWWSDPVIQHFKAKAQCIVEQYGNYTVPEADMLLNGINTQGENIADNGGVRQSFAAYRHWVETEGREEQKLPGLDFTHNQLFFLNFAQIWCNAMRPQSAVNRVLTGVHSPGRFRVIGVLQNSPDFAEAFNCPKTSYMNPPKKCTVW